MNRVESNLWKLSVIKLIRWFILVMPIAVLFYQSNGLSMRDILLLQSIFSVAIFLFEIPSGYFSDVVGRKTTIILAEILEFLGFFIYSISHGFFGFLLAELILGLGSSLMSGTDSAMLYDTLVELKKQDEYKKIEGKILAFGHFSEAIASVIGGFIAAISLRFPFYVQTFQAFISIFIAFSLVEPRIQKYENKEIAFKGMVKIVKYVFQHKRLKWLVIYSAVISASTLTMVWFVQPYFKSVGLPIKYFGIVWALLNASVGLFSMQAHKIEEFLGQKMLLISLIFLIFLGYLIIALFPSLFTIPFFLIFYFVRGVNAPVLKDYINKQISSNIRATVLSVSNLLRRLIFSVIGPFVGWISDEYSLYIALITSGVVFLFLGIISLVFLKKHDGL